MSPDPKKKKKKRTLTRWQKHVKATMAKFPGLSFKEVLPKAKLTYKKPRLSSPASPAPKKRGDRKMAKRKKGRKRSGFTLPLAIVAPVAGSFFIEGKAGWKASPYSEAMAGRFDHAMNHIISGWTGYSVPDKKFDFVNGATYLKITLVGTIVHFLASKFGVNRALGKAKVPVVRI